MQNQKRYNIKAVSVFTGISDYTIRSWERRYSALSPERTATNRRLYSDLEVEKLILLSNAVKIGHSIGNIAKYNSEELQELMGVTKDNISLPQNLQGDTFKILIDDTINCIKNLDSASFENILIKTSIDFSKTMMLTNFIIPLLFEIGIRWANGTLRIIHEHFASSLLRTFLGNKLQNSVFREDTPIILTTTPEGFLHELGALLAAVYAIDFGWHSIFLGPNLSAEEISAAIFQKNANAVLLSLIYPNDELKAGLQLRRLRKYLGENFPIILTGQAVSSYKEFSEEINAYSAYKLTDINEILSIIIK